MAHQKRLAFRSTLNDITLHYYITLYVWPGMDGRIEVGIEQVDRDSSIP